jgi:hypothetical protein
MARHVLKQWDRLQSPLSRSALPASARRPVFRPGLEALEAREVPSAAPLLQVSANGHYLVAAGTNQPFFIVGDSPWEMSTNITEAEASTYLQQRAAQGFNTIIMQAVNAVYTGAAEAHPPADTSGDLPFAKLADGNFDLSKPNTVYWQHIQNLVTMAGNDGIEVILFPAFYGTKIFSNDYDWGTQFNDPANTANNNANIKAWGQFLGQTFVNDNNIIWAVGGDYNNQENGASDGQLAALLQGIQQFDTRHLTTMEGWDGYNSSAPRTAFTNTALRPYMSLDGVYVSHTRPFSSLFQQEYSANNQPTFLIESTYEDNGTNTGGTTLTDIRHEAYVAFLSGTTGYMFGNDLVWEFGTGWQQQVATPGAQDMTYLGALVNSLNWSSLVPDWSGTVFQGVSTSSDYVGEVAADGSLALAYKPSTGSGSQSFTANLNKLNGTVTAKWFDPTNGTYITIGTFAANSGMQTFNSPATNSAGQNDFVLILTASPSANQAPAITSANKSTFTAGTAGSFTVTATGNPTPTLSESGTLPSGVTFNASTGVLGGTPAAGSGGTYNLVFTASNGFGSNATQNFTLTVDQAPAITSPGSTAFTVGSAGTFNLTGTGFPAPTFSESGTLPGGVTFNAGVLSGTPAAGSGGTYSLVFTASNGVGSNATLNFTLTVKQAPAITSASSATFTAGSAGSFTVTDSGFPTPTLSESGTLPSGVTFNASTGALSGTPAAGSNGTYNLVFTASNGVGSNATQNFTFTVNPATGNTVTLTPTANAYVRSGSYATTNFGGATQLVLKLGDSPGNTGWTRNDFFRFDISTLTSVNSAVLMLYGNINGTSPTNLGVSAYAVSDNTWTENGITWNNQPAIGTTALASNVVTDSSPRWYSFDITSYIQSAKAAGASQVSVALQMTTFDTGSYVVFNSREASNNTPELVVGTSSTATAPTIATQPASLTVTAGQPASFTVGANGTAPLTYQWQHQISGTWNNVGTNSATLAISAAQSSDAGNYQVIVSNSAGSVTSSTATLTVNVPAPAAPTNLSASAGNGQASLTWTAASGATSYNVYRGTTMNGESTAAIATNVSGTTFTNTGLTNGTTYYYKVAAVGTGGTSPLSGEASATPAAQVVIGEPNVLSSDDSNNGNWLIAQQTTLSQGATIQSLSFYASQAAGKLRLGIYDASGPNGGPGKLLASANEITPVVGWNTASVVTPVSLAASSYWLAFLPSDNNLHMEKAATGSAAWYQFTYGAMPATFSTTPTDATVHWSFYATLTLNAASGTPVTSISAGGPAAGSFVADTDFSGGNVSGGTTAPIDTSHLTNPPPQSVLQHGRYGNMTYTIPNLTPGATYTVRLDFVEYIWTAAGQRVFNVAINGTQVLSNFDIFAAAGGKNIAIAKTFTATADSTGKITITFTSIVDNAMINGIEILTGP